MTSVDDRHPLGLNSSLKKHSGTVCLVREETVFFFFLCHSCCVSSDHCWYRTTLVLCEPPLLCDFLVSWDFTTLSLFGCLPVQRPCWEIHIIKRLSEISGESRMAAVWGGLLRRQRSVWTSFKSSLINVFPVECELCFFPLLSCCPIDIVKFVGASVQDTAPTKPHTGTGRYNEVHIYKDT